MKEMKIRKQIKRIMKERTAMKKNKNNGVKM